MPKICKILVPLASAFLEGMKRAGMASTGKRFPGHGSVQADSHVASRWIVVVMKKFIEKDMQSFIQLQPQLDALMPAHVIYVKCRPKSCRVSRLIGFKGITPRITI